MKKLIQLVFLMALGNFAHAQVWSAGGHFNGGIAVGELKNEVGGLFIPSLSGLFLYEAPTAPVSLGLELG
ncbi:hypothetical protein Aoki45_28080 [Algoriphagus sp. oki45]|uniref:hypothetical protein n=1 Tax=Algoriphagus sp. oki45 TaxID=3067294 RepID=UPI0027F0D703|nr:hypothetical protein Aoki45_28080 [Algoriphagus sp. oki45]